MIRLLSIALVALVASQSLAEDWPAWRGPRGTGESTASQAPLSWSKTENVKWRVELDGPGNSTPIVVGDRVFLTHSPKDTHLRGLRCYDRKTGELLWKQEVEYAEEERTHDTNPYCSASPVSDGQCVVAWFGSAGLHCYDLQGKQLWQVETGKVEHIWGYGSSPVLHKNLVVQLVGPGLNAFVAAYDKQTGEQVWRKEYPGMTSTKFDEFRGSWSTPVVHEQPSGASLLLSLPQRLLAVDPSSGEEQWSCEGMSLLSYTSPLIAGDIVVAMCGYGGPALAVRGGGQGNVTETHRLWLQDKKNPQRVGSGVVVGKQAYLLNENGVAICLDAETGEKRWEQRLDGGNSWGSMTHVAGRLYVPTMKGDTFVLEANPEACKVLAENKLGETTRGSLAFSKGDVFLRTYEALYCFGEQ